MVSINDALKEVDSVYESYDYEGNYSVIFKNGDVYDMNTNASDPNGLCMYAGDVDQLPGARDGNRINKRSLPDKTKIAISRVVEPRNLKVNFTSLGHEDALREEMIEENAGYQGWVKEKPIPVDELDEYMGAVGNTLSADLIRQFKAVSWDKDDNTREENYSDVYWEYINGYLSGVEELLEAKGYTIER